MSKLKIKLVKFEKALAFQVLEMDERFRAITREGSTSNGSVTQIKRTSKKGNIPLWIVSESRSPEISCYKDVLYLRSSNKDADFIINTTYFKSNQERDGIYRNTSLRSRLVRREGIAFNIARRLPPYSIICPRAGIC